MVRGVTPRSARPLASASTEKRHDRELFRSLSEHERAAAGGAPPQLSSSRRVLACSADFWSRAQSSSEAAVAVVRIGRDPLR
jgi:hypothetical protein